MEQKDLLIKAEELAQLYNFLGEIPHKFGGPLDAFLKALQMKRAQEESASVDKKAVKLEEELA